jgi:4-methyl-5(b-hydroxyethyl)-thiazole monophosphate biosynthesis
MVYVFLAEGFEEIEALSPVDILKRAGISVKTVAVTKSDLIVKGSHSISVTADIHQKKVVIDNDTEMIVLPGGMPGTKNLEKSDTVQSAIDFCVKNDKYIAAICAAPSILGHKGLLDGKAAVCYPGFEKELGDYKPAKIQTFVDGQLGLCYTGAPVAIDGKIITCNAMGNSVLFGLRLVQVLIDSDKATNISRSIRFNGYSENWGFVTKDTCSDKQKWKQQVGSK